MSRKKKKKKYDWTWIKWRELEFGVRQYECYIKYDSAPAGFVWGMAAKVEDGKTVFLVQHSFVHLWARRRGVRSAIQAQLMKDYHAVFTWAGTKSGVRFMKATGYKRLRPWGLWIQDPKPKKRKSRKKK